MGTHYQGTAEETRALNAFISLTRAANSLTSALVSQKAYGDLTVSQFGVLEALFHLGPLSQRELAEKLLRSTGNLVTVIDNLERRSLVARTRHKTDRRIFEIALTDEGRALIAELFPRHVEAVVSALGALGAEDQETLRRLCRTLGLALASTSSK